MLQVKKIVGNLLSSNMYILFEDGISDCWLIDIGDFFAVKNELSDGWNVKGVFLTHSHFDHIAGINDLSAKFPDSKVYTSEYGKEGIYSNKKNFSLYHEQPVVYEGENVVVLYDGNSVELFDGISLNVMATQGHCQSCLTYYTDSFVFTGDSYIPGVPVVTKLPKGNQKDSEASVLKILELAKTRTILAGHDKENWISWI